MQKAWSFGYSLQKACWSFGLQRSPWGKVGLRWRKRKKMRRQEEAMTVEVDKFDKVASFG